MHRVGKLLVHQQKRKARKTSRPPKPFWSWVITSDEGRDALANQMGFVTPFSTFDAGYTAHNALLDAASEDLARGAHARELDLPHHAVGGLEKRRGRGASGVCAGHKGMVRGGNGVRGRLGQRVRGGQKVRHRS